MSLPRRRAVLLAARIVVAACGPDDASRPPTAGPSATGAASEAPASNAPAPASASPAAPGLIDLQVVVGDVTSPVDVAWRPAAPDDIFVVEQGGTIRIVRDGATLPQPFLDISSRVRAGGEQGLLGLAFPPDAGDRRFFVYYTALDGSQVLASFATTAAAPDQADPATERIILQMPDQFGNHNGGSLAFGPDGFLYVGTGDGGGGGDPLGSGRSLATLLAKVLRLDVSPEATTADQPYGIPADNPFVDTAGARPEIFVTGLRNPWRFRFDPETKDLWIGDVGQGAWEEVDVVRSGQSGLDFGWNRMEGFHCYEPRTGCDQTGLTLPVTEYGHDRGCSITGGTVYRGSAVPVLDGRYVFSDYCSGTVWSIAAAGDARREPEVARETDASISAIAAAPDGELYATDLGGALLRVVSAPGS
jgi:glucose/arabinose dehydrogenase